MDVVLISTYELGQQPFGLASPAAWLREAGARVTCVDLSRVALPEEPVQEANLIAFHVPMHTATRLAIEWLGRVRALNPRAHVCFYGLYAALNETYLRRLGVGTVLAGEFEEGLVALVERLARERGSERAGPPASPSRQADRPECLPHPQTEPAISTARQRFRVPDRSGLPDLRHYARLETAGGERRIVGYTEASRGCQHLCRHCPIVPVYQGRFRIVQREVVLADIRQQVAAGAEHITFGDPDFWNGVGHSLAIIEALHSEFPRLTYDVTIKIEHLLRYAHLLRRLRDTGCLFVTSAVESFDDRFLCRIEKGHTREDFLRAVELFREVGLGLSPTFIPFHPWTTVEGYREMLALLAELGLVESVAPVQLAIRLLIPAGSKLLEVPEVRARIGEFEEQRLSYRWTHGDPRVERLYREVQKIVRATPSEPRASASVGASAGKLPFPHGRGSVSSSGRLLSRAEIFAQVREATQRMTDGSPEALVSTEILPARAAVPFLTEPWFC